MQRSLINPILSRTDIPDIPPHVVDVSSVFNPGAVRFGEKYLLMLRVQTRARETVLMLAESLDGERFEVQPRLMEIEGIERVSEKIYHIYDPRITPIDGAYLIMLAADTNAGCRLMTVLTEDFTQFEMLGFDSAGDTRNGVLFPELFDGKYLRLERRNVPQADGNPATGSAISLSESADMQTWNQLGDVMNGRPRYWDELIGAGPPPVKTRDGWLLVYHGVATHFASANIYQAGVALLDLANPQHVLSRSRGNILEPREHYEQTGQVPNVVLPSGMVVDEYDTDGFAKQTSTARLYYGAADTCIGMATTTVQYLIDSCEEADDLQ